MKKYTPFIFSLLILASCNSNSSKERNDNKLESFDIETKEKRIEILSKQIKIYSEILDTEFSLFNANGFESKFVFVPAASYPDYKIAVKVDKNDQ